MIAPNGFGNPVRPNWSWILNYSLVAASYVGLVVLALFAAGLVSRRTERRDRLWALYAILLLIIALGWTPVGKLVNELPPFSITANDKLRFVALFIAAVVAARVLDRISYWYLLFGGTIAATPVYVYVQRPAMQRPSDLVAPTIVILLAAVLLFARRYAPATAFVLLTIDLFVLNAGFNALVNAHNPLLDALNVRFLLRSRGWSREGAGEACIAALTGRCSRTLPRFRGSTSKRGRAM